MSVKSIEIIPDITYGWNDDLLYVRVKITVKNPTDNKPSDDWPPDNVKIILVFNGTFDSDEFSEPWGSEEDEIRTFTWNEQFFRFVIPPMTGHFEVVVLKGDKDLFKQQLDGIEAKAEF
jgi:hypothetical protein